MSLVIRDALQCLAIPIHDVMWCVMIINLFFIKVVNPDCMTPKSLCQPIRKFPLSSCHHPSPAQQSDWIVCMLSSSCTHFHKTKHKLVLQKPSYRIFAQEKDSENWQDKLITLGTCKLANWTHCKFAECAEIKHWRVLWSHCPNVFLFAGSNNFRTPSPK